MDTLVVVLIVAAVVGFLLWKNKDKIAARVSRPAPTPVPTPIPTPVPLPPVDVVDDSPHIPTISRPMSQFEMLVAQGLDLYTIVTRMGRTLSDAEQAYARAHNVPGSAVVEQAAPAGGSAADYESEEFTWAAPNSPRIFRNGTTKILKVPADFHGTINLHNGDVAGNVATSCMFSVLGPEVSIYQLWPTRYQSLSFKPKPGGEYRLNAGAVEPLAMSVRFEPV